MLTIEEAANIIEGILFLSPTPVLKKDISEHLRIDVSVVEEAVEMLIERFKEGGLEIIKAAGGYEIATRKEYNEHLKTFFGKMDSTRLSRAALETIAIIAYKQPVSRADIEQVRGVNSSGVIKSLLDRGLVTIAGKGDGIGRPYLFSTTSDFLRFVGMDTLEDLPPLENFEKKI